MYYMIRFYESMVWTGYWTNTSWLAAPTVYASRIRP